MQQRSVTRRQPTGGLAEVIDVILDKGMVIDAFVRVALVGIELVTIDARIVIASVDTYLHFAEVAGRLDLRESAEETQADMQDLIGQAGLGGVGQLAANGLDSLTSDDDSFLDDVSDKVKEMVGAEDDGSEDSDDE